MTPKSSSWFWLKVLLAAATLGAVAFTLISPQWIEHVVGVDPDRGSGTLEWAFADALFCCLLGFVALGLVFETQVERVAGVLDWGPARERGSHGETP